MNAHHNNEYIWVDSDGSGGRDETYHITCWWGGWMGGGGRSGIQIKDKLNRLPRRNEQQTLHGMDDITVTTST